ncbi:MAG: DNA helicase II, partial [Acetobacter orientalis]
LIYHADRRRIYANWQPSLPSRFLDELPEEHVVRKNNGGTQPRGLNLSESVFDNGPLTSRRRQDPLAASTTLPNFQLGDQVRHPRFGVGVIIGADRHQLEVVFESGATKRLLSSFIEKV